MGHVAQGVGEEGTHARPLIGRAARVNGLAPRGRRQGIHALEAADIVGQLVVVVVSEEAVDGFDVAGELGVEQVDVVAVILGVVEVDGVGTRHGLAVA